MASLIFSVVLSEAFRMQRTAEAASRGPWRPKGNGLAISRPGGAVAGGFPTHEVERISSVERLRSCGVEGVEPIEWPVPCAHQHALLARRGAARLWPSWPCAPTGIWTDRQLTLF